MCVFVLAPHKPWKDITSQYSITTKHSDTEWQELFLEMEADFEISLKIKFYSRTEHILLLILLPLLKNWVIALIVVLELTPMWNPTDLQKGLHLIPEGMWKSFMSDSAKHNVRMLLWHWLVYCVI